MTARSSVGSQMCDASYTPVEQHTFLVVLIFSQLPGEKHNVLPWVWAEDSEALLSKLLRGESELESLTI